MKLNDTFERGFGDFNFGSGGILIFLILNIFNGEWCVWLEFCFGCYLCDMTCYYYNGMFSGRIVSYLFFFGNLSPLHISMP